MTDRVHPPASHLGIRWRLVTNHFDGDTFRAALTLTNHGSVRLPGSGWSIYFNGCRKPLPDSVTGGVTIEHVNGDLFKMTPAAHFGTLAPGVSREIGYVAQYWSVLATDAPMGFFIVYDEGTPAARVEAIGDATVEPFATDELTTRSPNDRIPPQTAARRFAENEELTLLPPDAIGRVTPQPRSISFGAGSFAIDAETIIVHPPELAEDARILRKELASLMTGPLQLAASGKDGAIQLQIEPNLPVPDGAIVDDSYRLVVTPTRITLSGRTPAAIGVGIQTLRQLLPIAAWQNTESVLRVPCCEVNDGPRFSYRGLHLDVGRNFSSAGTVVRVLDLMALYKLNRLHFHLTDDEGWRVPIASLPELTEIGARRGFAGIDGDELPPSFGSGPDDANPQGSGHYTRDEFIAILRHAHARHIEVIPEIDLPGHARAAIRAMQVRYRRLCDQGRVEEAEAYRLVDLNDASKYESVQMWKDNVVCIGLESCYTFLETVVRDIQAMYDDAGVPMRTLHVGGDEVPRGVWEHSPICLAFMREHRMNSVHELQDYFFTRFRDILRRRGLTMAGWEEVALVHDESAGVRPNAKLTGGTLRPYVWNNVWGWGREDVAYRLANAGYEVVLCNVTNLYLDLAYEKDPDEPGYYWGGFLDVRKVFEFCPLDIYCTASTDLLGNPLDRAKLDAMERLTPEGATRVLGLQGHLWGENLRDATRTEYLLVPRLLAVAERAWARDPGWSSIADDAERARRMHRDWNEFANRLGQRELPRLDGLLGGVGYRIPPPGGVVREGKLVANVAMPGMTLRYTLDGSEPTAASALYREPVAVPSGAPVAVAAFSTTGRRGRTVRVA